MNTRGQLGLAFTSVCGLFATIDAVTCRIAFFLLLLAWKFLEENKRKEVRENEEG
jgi:hypothetical protein